MEFYSKSAIAEGHFQKASYYIIQERQITKRYARQSKALKENNLHVANKTPQYGVCAGL